MAQTFNTMNSSDGLYDFFKQYTQIRLSTIKIL